MKALKLYIKEALHINKDTKGDYYNYHPKTKDELNELIEKLIEERGKNADLNDIDVSAITDMSYIFFHSNFNGDISKWDVSNVDDMLYMFNESPLHNNLPKWYN